MTDSIETKTLGKYTATLINDRDPQNPRTEYENATTMWCAHGRYDLGDPSNPWPKRACSRDEIEANVGSLAIIKPLYMYDHSGITIATTPFSCRWDSGQIGWVFISDADAAYEQLSADMLDTVLEAEVTTYDRYLRGEVYEWAVHKGDEYIEGCGGYDDEKYAWEEALAELEARNENDPETDELSAAEILVHAYANAASVGWADMNRAHAKACDELGPARVKEIKAIYEPDT